jgi:uncharacterized protein (UPF0548 family)
MVAMAVQEGSRSVWFGLGRQKDAQYLQKWRGTPLTYSPNQEIPDRAFQDENWNLDRYEIILGQDASGALFQRAAQLVLANQFYPSEVMTTVSDFGLVGRPVQPGDRVLQRIRIFQYRGLPILEILTMNEITEVIQEPRRAGFTYTTTSAHAEIGEWAPTVEWRENGEVALVISVVSRPRSAAFSRSFARRLQLRAHKLSIHNFLASLSGMRYMPSTPQPSTAASLLPVAMLLTAMLLFLYMILGFGKKN